MITQEQQRRVRIKLALVKLGFRLCESCTKRVWKRKEKWVCDDAIITIDWK